MCLIIVKKRGQKLPSREFLEDTYFSNPDGSGFAYWRNGKNHLRKGFFNVDAWMDAIYKEVREDDLLVIHSRIMTSGVKDAGNTQPFVVSNDTDVITSPRVDTPLPIVAHNGIISNLGNHKYSDTIEFIQIILSDKNVIDKLKSPAIRKLIERSIDSSRLAIIKDGELYLIGEWALYNDKGTDYLVSHVVYNWKYYVSPKKDNETVVSEREYWKEVFNQMEHVYGRCDLCGKKGLLVELSDGTQVCEDCFADEYLV